MNKAMHLDHYIGMMAKSLVSHTKAVGVGERIDCGSAMEKSVKHSFASNNTSEFHVLPK